MPTRHQLLIKQDAKSAQALTKPSTVIIEKKLSIGNHALDIFASQISCCAFDGVEPKSLKNKSFTPFTTVMVRRKIGEDRIKHKFHGDDVHEKFAYFPTVVLGRSIKASFSIGSNVQVSIPSLDISGILSAISIEINGIQQGLIGQFDACVSLAPMVFKPFKGQVSLMNYFDPTLLYEISPGGETVFKSVLSSPLRNLTPRLPRMLLQADGTLGISPANLRRLLPREKEEQLLTKVMLGEFGRGFLTREANTPQRMMQYLEANTIHYSQSAQKLITTQHPGMVLQQTANNALSVVQPNFVGKVLALSEPCIVDTIETMVFEDGHTEAVLVPTAFFPKHFDNRRLRDGAGCLFALENITLSGVPGSALHVRGNLEGEEIVIQGLETLTRTRNTYTRYETVTQESKQKSLMGKNETTLSFQQVGITELQPGNEMVARRGVRFLNVKNIYLSGARDQLGPAGLVVKNADSFVDAAIVRNRIGTAVSVQQKGCLGMGGTSTSVTPVLQEVIGSEIATKGPISIQARYGQFDATRFRSIEGKKPKVEFKISELHFHELLRAVEANNRASEALLLSELKAQARTAKRKSRQSTTLLLISIPVSYYTGGLISSYLQSSAAMGVTISASVVNGARVAATASFAQTVTIVGLSGMGAGLASAAIQGQPLAKAAIHGAVFSLVGHGIAHAPVLAAESQLVQDVARGVGAGSVSAVLNHGNILESALIGGASAGVASTVVSGARTSLSMTETVSKVMVETTVAATLSGGTNNLVANLASAAMGAAIGETMSDLGGQHGQQLGSKQPVNVTTTSTATSTSSSSSAGALVSAAKPQKPQPTRRTGLVGSDFERELNAVHQSARDLFFDAEMEHCLNHTSRGFGRMQAESNTLEMKDVFDTQPGLLWSAPNRFNRASAHTFPSRSTMAQDGRQPKGSHSNQYLDGLGQGAGRAAMAVLNMFVGEVHAAELSDLNSFQNSTALTPFQQDMRNRLPKIAAFFDGVRETDEQVKVGVGRCFVNRYEGLKQFTLEVGEKFNLVPSGSVSRYTTEILAEREFYDSTPVGRSTIAKASEWTTELGVMLTVPVTSARGLWFVASAAGTGAVIGGLQVMQDGQLSTRFENAAYGALGGVAGGTLGAYIVPKAIDVTGKAITFGYRAGVKKLKPQVANVAELFSELGDFVAERTFRSPITLQYDSSRLCSSFPVDIFKPRVPWVKKDILSEKARLYPSPLFRHEERIIEQWVGERLRLLQQWKFQDVSAVNPEMRVFLNKCRSQLRDHMTPDDLAAIMKEQRGVKIFKEKGGVFDHINNEWQQARNSFKNAIEGPRSMSIQEEQIVNERFGDISRMWTTYREMIERAKCNPEMRKLKN